MFTKRLRARMAPEDIAGAAIDHYRLLLETWDCSPELARTIAVDHAATEAAVHDWLAG